MLTQPNKISDTIFFKIEDGNFDEVREIIKSNPEVLNQKDQFGVTPIFRVIAKGDLEFLKELIVSHPEVLKQRDPNKLSPVFYAIRFNNLEFLKELIVSHPEVLKQRDPNKLSPVFYAIARNNFEAVEVIIKSNPKTLKQTNLCSETPILYLFRNYDYKPLKENKDLLKFIFKKQFKRDLEDEEIKNLVDFVQNFNFLKLFYNELGQGFYNNQLDKLFPSFLPNKADLADGFKKDLVETYEKILQPEIPSIPFQDDNGGNKSLHIYKAGLGGHSAYFIFHFDDDAKQLTSISYCDGNKYFDYQKIDNSSFINGIRTFKLKDPKSFIDSTLTKEQFFQEFVKKTSQGKDYLFFSKEDLSDEKLAQKQIGGIEFSEIIGSIPLKPQSRSNCTLKSLNTLAKFVLEVTKGGEIFTFDPTTSKQGGGGYEAYKELKQQIVDNATEKLIESAKIIEKDFTRETEAFERIFDFLDRSFVKEGNKKDGSTTKFLSITNPKFHNFMAQIMKAKICSDDKEFRQKLNSEDLKNYLNFIFHNNINFDEIEIEKTGSLLAEKNVKIDGFLDQKFPSFEVKNSFVKLVLEYGNQEQRSDFMQQILHLDSDKRDKFFEGLKDEILALIIRETEERKSKLREGDSGQISLDSPSSSEDSSEKSKQNAGGVSLFDCVRVEEFYQVGVGEKRLREEGGASSEIDEVKKDPFACERIEKKLRECDFGEEKVDGKNNSNDRDKGNEGAGLSPRIVGADGVVGREFTP